MKSLSLKEIREKVEALEKEVRLQRSFLEVIQEPFILLDPKGDFLKVNPKGMEILVYPREELQQKVFIDVVPLEDLPEIEKGSRRWDKGKRFDSGHGLPVGWENGFLSSSSGSSEKISFSLC